MNSISPLTITAHTFAIERELSDRRHDAAVHGELRGLLPGNRKWLFGLRLPSLRLQRAPRPNARYSGTACAR